MKIWKRRNRRMAESKAAIERSERLGEYIDMQRQEAAEVGAWARERMEANHLSRLFYATPRGGRR